MKNFIRAFYPLIFVGAVVIGAVIGGLAGAAAGLVIGLEGSPAVMLGAMAMVGSVGVVAGAVYGGIAAAKGLHNYEKKSSPRSIFMEIIDPWEPRKRNESAPQPKHTFDISLLWKKALAEDEMKASINEPAPSLAIRPTLLTQPSISTASVDTPLATPTLKKAMPIARATYTAAEMARAEAKSKSKSKAVNVSFSSSIFRLIRNQSQQREQATEPKINCVARM